MLPGNFFYLFIGHYIDVEEIHTVCICYKMKGESSKSQKWKKKGGIKFLVIRIFEEMKLSTSKSELEIIAFSHRSRIKYGGRMGVDSWQGGKVLF